MDTGFFVQCIILWQHMAKALNHLTRWFWKIQDSSAGFPCWSGGHLWKCLANPSSCSSWVPGGMGKDQISATRERAVIYSPEIIRLLTKGKSLQKHLHLCKLVTLGDNELCIITHIYPHKALRKINSVHLQSPADSPFS